MTVMNQAKVTPDYRYGPNRFLQNFEPRQARCDLWSEHFWVKFRIWHYQVMVCVRVDPGINRDSSQVYYIQANAIY